MMDNLKVFAGSSNEAFAQEICAVLDTSLGKLEVARFSNDNISIQILENVRERDVFVVQSFSGDVNDCIIELFIILDALRSASAKRITAVIPYFSYARSDKKDAPRISIAARLMADLLKTAGADRVLTMDLHSDQVHGFFSMPVDHLTAIPALVEYFHQNCDSANTVAVATDAGGAKRVGRFAERLGIPLAIIDKRRINDENVKHGLVVGEVAGKDAIIFDDEIAAATTLVSTAETLLKAGVKSVSAGATHGVFCGPAIQRLRDSAFSRIVVTNTVALSPEKQLPSIKTLSVAPIFAEAIRRIHTGESIGALFSRKRLS
jgi:ribose-phosphate pyrophosphokinase